MTAILKCDQAIFTSIRGPMGEGYRIVAASRGVRPEEKQVITRCSPSHEALCWSPEEEPTPGAWYGAAFYPLPTGRFCVAYSRFAGAEHTARGGQRVYTHNVILDVQHFPLCGFNPFHVLRAMLAAGLNEPQLKPPNVLDELTLRIEPGGAAKRDGQSVASIETRLRRAALRLMFEQRTFALPRHDSWIESAEALLLGLPGPMRAKFSFSAGLKFAMSRNHKVQVFRDDDASSRNKVEGQSGEYLTAADVGDEASKSAWVKFVDGHWTRKAVDQLDRRTSRPFTDVSPPACERVAGLYNQIDDMPAMKPRDLLSTVTTQLTRTAKDVEEQVRGELIAEGKKELSARVARITVEEFNDLWPALCAGMKGGGATAVFAEPFVVGTLGAVSRKEPLHAAEAACEILAAITKSADTVLDEILAQLCPRVAQLLPDNSDRLSRLHARLSAIRPDHAAVKRLRVLLDSALKCTTAH